MESGMHAMIPFSLVLTSNLQVHQVPNGIFMMLEAIAVWYALILFAI